MNTWLVVLTSSAVGVLVGSVVTLIGQSLERRARRDELLLTKALECAIQRTDVLMKAAELNKVPFKATFTDDVINAETYYRWLKSLLDTGKLPPDADEAK